MTPIRFHFTPATNRQPGASRTNYTATYSRAIRLAREEYRRMRGYQMPPCQARLVIVSMVIALANIPSETS